MQKILFLLFILTYSISFSQIDKKLLEGDWIVYKKEMKDGSKYFSQNPSSNISKIYVFRKNRLFIKNYITQNNYYHGEQIKIENNVILGHYSNYVIEKITSDDLILSENNPKKNDNFSLRYYLKRYDYQRNLDLEQNKGKEILLSTPALSPFPTQDILQQQFRIENITPFKTKGYLLFNLEKGSIEAFLTDKSEITQYNENKIKEIFNFSYDFWDFSKVKDFKYVKLPFVIIVHQYKVRDNIYSNMEYSYNTNEYEDIQLPLDTQNIENGEKFHQLALSCFENKNYICSIQNFKNSFEQNKYNLDAHYNYASINFALGKKEEACKKWKELIGYGQKEAEREYQQNNCNN